MTPTPGISYKCALSQILRFEGTYFVDQASCEILGIGTGWGSETHQNYPWSKFLPPRRQWHPSKLKKIQSNQLDIKWSVFLCEVNHAKGAILVFVASRLRIQRTNGVIGLGKWKAALFGSSSVFQLGNWGHSIYVSSMPPGRAAGKGWLVANNYLFVCFPSYLFSMISVVGGFCWLLVHDIKVPQCLEKFSYIRANN